VLEVVVEKNSPVWPVVPAGKGLHEFVTYPEIVEDGPAGVEGLREGKGEQTVHVTYDTHDTAEGTV
jgi:hypothetical protein